jgi:Na+/melibiose symporter-like transporter
MVEYHKLTSVLIRQSGLIFLIMLVAVVVGFACVNYWAPEIKSRLLPAGPLVVILVLAPLLLCLGALTLLNQSLGRDDLYIVSIFRIFAPLVVMSIWGGSISAWSFTLSFTAIVLFSVLVGFKIHSRSLLHHLS